MEVLLNMRKEDRKLHIPIKEFSVAFIPVVPVFQLIEHGSALLNFGAELWSGIDIDNIPSPMGYTTLSYTSMREHVLELRQSHLAEAIKL